MKYITCLLVVLMSVLSVLPPADAAFSPSEFISAVRADRAADIRKIQGFLETRLVRERLEKLGFTRDEILQRLGSLDDQQIHYYAQNLDDLRVGGDGVEVLIILLLAAILVVLVLQYTGHRIIITK